jgi:hypothetical protein
MALWTIMKDVEVIYEAKDERQVCGDSDSKVLAEIENWVTHEAMPWDMLVSPSGLFVRCEAPLGPV